METFRACPIPVLVGEAETGKICHYMVVVGHTSSYYLLFVYIYVGKTTAAKTALSLVGQAKNGFLMKTKRTSDAIIIERCCTSTLPFCLDYPKTTDGIGEILIELCNGEPLANMKTGLRKPKSVPIICANFTIKDSRRYV